LTLLAVAACLPFAGLACGDDAGSTASGSSAADGVFTSMSDDGVGSTEATTNSDDGEKLDLAATSGGSADGSGEAGEEGCKAVDFLFVIDNSGSMGDNQAALVNSFQPFMDAILQTVDAGDDYHIMVTKTDSGWFPFECNVFCALSCPDLPAGLCENMQAPSECDDRLGAGVTFPLGGDSSNMQCNLAGGNRYILASEPDLASAFTCVAQVGTDGDSDEKPMAALTNALSGELQDAGGCNEGFLRDDAILVVTIITDEEDSSSPGTPAGWHQNLLASKSNDPGAFVMLGLINDTDAAMPVCPAEAQDPVRLREFTSMFPNHIFGSVCNTDGYGAFFEQAVELIDTTCDDFMPPG
jgi:hypothetical protein